MVKSKFVAAAQAAHLIPDGGCLGIIGDSGLVDLNILPIAIEPHGMDIWSSYDPIVIPALGIGDRDRRGLNRPASLKRVVGGHWI